MSQWLVLLFGEGVLRVMKKEQAETRLKHDQPASASAHIYVHVALQYIDVLCIHHTNLR